ncbi:hypothetical protein ACGFI9_35095 [Micromonospora sp. NPDC048930]|uniref:hypothetical protein n=1 Tax=Micromonospora sp. NPDC048930 TaxID=3364261 RepID=UPI0037149AFF
MIIGCHPGGAKTLAMLPVDGVDLLLSAGGAASGESEAPISGRLADCGRRRDDG